jgi:uroporphyrinogen-III synthase
MTSWPGLHDQRKPLAGRGILVTRPLERSAGLAALIESAGGVAHVYPAMRIEALPDEAAARERLARLRDYQLVIFVSPTAVERAFAMLSAWPAGVHAAAVGASTRDELASRGVADVLAPDTGADSEALLARPELSDMTGRRVLIVRGVGGRPLLGETLQARGARVDYAECYRRAAPAAPSPELIAAWSQGRIDAVTASSASGVAHLFEAFMSQAEQLQRTPLFVPHERVAQAAKRCGARQVLVAGPTDGEVVSRLVAYFRGR